MLNMTAPIIIRLEAIGDNWRYYARQLEAREIRNPNWRDQLNAIRYGQKRHRGWVARLIGLDARYGFRREFLEGPRDYTQADSMGQRGIYEYFYLSDGLYEINEPTGLGKSRRYFASVADDAMTEIGRDVVVLRLTPRDPNNPRWD